jgi:DinB superfamily
MTADPVTEFERYREQLLAALGDDKPVAVLRSTLDELSSLLEDKSAEHLKRRPVPGEWGARQVLNHLADTDLVYGVRVRMMVTQERPMIVGYDQDAWNDRFGDLDAAPWETLERWKALRRANLRVYESLTPNASASGFIPNAARSQLS